MTTPLLSVGRKPGLLSLLTLLLMVPCLGVTPTAADVQDQRIEITIRDNTFLRTKTVPIHTGFPTIIVIRNEDAVRHGFTSSMLAGLSVHAEGDGIESYGKGIDGFYIGPHKTLTIRFITQHQGQFTFECDLHRDLKGEIYLLDVPVA